MSGEYEKLIEAARAVVTTWLQTGLAPTRELTTLQSAVANVSALPPASPAPARVEVEPIAGGAVVTNAYPPTGYFDPKPSDPAPAKGVRCFRHVDGFNGKTDRVRYTNGVAECIGEDGSVVESMYGYDLAYAERMVKQGSWVECPDTPYAAPTVKDSLTVAPPVAAPSPAMPPRESFTTASPADALRPNDRHACTPTAPRETAEKVAAIAMHDIDIPSGPGKKILGDWTYRGQGIIAGLLTARDATFTADLAAKDRTIAERDAKTKELEENVQRRIAVNLELRAKINALESRLAEREAGGGELLETATAAMAMIISKIPLTESNAWDTSVPRKVADGAVNYARALHAALADRGQG